MTIDNMKMNSSSVVSFALVGQAMIRGDLREHAPGAVPELEALLKSDFALTGYEATVLDPSGEQGPVIGRFLAPPETLDMLQGIGFNLLALPNNHSFDLGATGIANTIERARKIDLAVAGTGKDLAAASAITYLRTSKGTVALIAMASGLIEERASATAAQPGVNELRLENGKPKAEDAARILGNIRDARANADFVVVYQHNHAFDVDFRTMLDHQLPERLEPPKWLVDWSHSEIDAGADIICMHGAPFLHGIEIYRGKPIFYDLGNFIFQAPPSSFWLDEPIAWHSVVAHAEFENGKLCSVKLQPIVMNTIGEGQPDVHDHFANNQFLKTRGIPKAAKGIQARLIIEHLANLSRPFRTSIQIEGEAVFIKIANI